MRSSTPHAANPPVPPQTLPPRALPTADDRRATGRRAARWVWRGAAAAALLLVFLSYWRPETMIGLANQLWSCL